MKYNYLFDLSYKFLKNQEFFFIYQSFLKKNKIKFLIIFDYEYFFNFLTYFNSLNMTLFSFIPVNYLNQYIDFYLLTLNQYKFFYKIIYYSYILYLLNLNEKEKKKNFKVIFFKNYNAYKNLLK